jgi:hypothetical protein
VGGGPWTRDMGLCIHIWLHLESTYIRCWENPWDVLQEIRLFTETQNPMVAVFIICDISWYYPIVDRGSVSSRWSANRWDDREIWSSDIVFGGVKKSMSW